jgi:F-type H+-transporting ATPase subunit delta
MTADERFQQLRTRTRGVLTAVLTVAAVLTVNTSAQADRDKPVPTQAQIDQANAAAAEKAGDVAAIEDELFRFERILQTESEVAGLLDEYTVDPARRIALLDRLVEAKVSPITLQLLRHAVTSQRKRSITLAIDDLLEKAAERQERSVARVISAVPLTDAQQVRLAGALSALYGRPISVRTAIDTDVRGGLIVRVGDEVIDGSIATRFAEARAALAG